MAPTDPGCTIDLGMRAAGNLFLVQARQYCHCTLSSEPSEQLIRKGNVPEISRPPLVRRRETDRSAAMRLKAAGMRTPRNEYLNLQELKAEERREHEP